MEINELTERIIGAAIAVHRALGPGLLESAYEACMAHELVERGLKIVRQHRVPLVYKGVKLECAYIIDIIVEGLVILELKSVERLDPIHEAQMLSYMKLTGVRVGLLINFNVPLLKDGIKRMII